MTPTLSKIQYRSAHNDEAAEACRGMLELNSANRTVALLRKRLLSALLCGAISAPRPFAAPGDGDAHAPRTANASL